jgi:hypothetical protein
MARERERAREIGRERRRQESDSVTRETSA